jgi:hypothetical protein
LGFNFIASAGAAFASERGSQFESPQLQQEVLVGDGFFPTSTILRSRDLLAAKSASSELVV